MCLWSSLLACACGALAETEQQKNAATAMPQMGMNPMMMRPPFMPMMNPMMNPMMMQQQQQLLQSGAPSSPTAPAKPFFDPMYYGMWSWWNPMMWWYMPWMWMWWWWMPYMAYPYMWGFY
jgi:hypothetical protein